MIALIASAASTVSVFELTLAGSVVVVAGGVDALPVSSTVTAGVYVVAEPVMLVAEQDVDVAPAVQLKPAGKPEGVNET